MVSALAARHCHGAQPLRFIGRGEGIHWPDLDEDISVEGLVLGKPSGESQPSFARWLEKRGKHGKK